MNNNNFVESIAEQQKYLCNRCIERYGYKTCLLIQQVENGNDYNVIPLDNDDNINSTLNNSDFFTIIPSLLDKKYTVVIINYINSTTLDIIAVHQPGQKQLNLPPIFI